MPTLLRVAICVALTVALLAIIYGVAARSCAAPNREYVAQAAAVLSTAAPTRTVAVHIPAVPPSP